MVCPDICSSSQRNTTLYSYLVGYCPISDLFGKEEPILSEAYAEPNISSPLPHKSDIGQAAYQTTVLLFLSLPNNRFIIPVQNVHFAGNTK